MNEEKVIDGDFTPVEEVENVKPQAPQKPMSVMIADFKDALVEVINNCPLPLQVSGRIYDELGAEVKQAAAQQAEAERREYEAALAAYRAS